MGAESTDDRREAQPPEAETQRVEALRALHDRYAGMLWRYVVSLTHRPADADDIVQETLLRAWHRPSLLAEDPGQVRGWLVTVAHNLVVDQVRSAYRRHEEPMAEQVETTAEDRIDRLFDALLLRDALASLGVDHREVIVRAYYGGCSTTELAAELGIPEGTVKSRLHYGVRALRLAFEERGVIR